MRVTLFAAFAVAILSLFPAAPGFAHEGHDHGPAPSLAPASVKPRGEATTAQFELVAVANGSELLIYLDRFDNNAPVEGAAIEVETPDGPAHATAAPGGYRVAAPWLSRETHVDLVFTVTAGDVTDILPVTLDIKGDAAAPAPTAFANAIRNFLQPAPLLAGLAGLVLGIGIMALTRRRPHSLSILVIGAALAIVSAPSLAHEGDGHAETSADNSSPVATEAQERAQRLPDGGLFVPKSVQRVFEIRTTKAEIITHRRVVELPGRIIPDPNASGFVQAAIAGRLSPPDGGFPHLGTRVTKGDVLGYVTAPLQAIDVSDMRQRQGELDQQIAIVERRLARYETLAPSGSVSRTQLEDTRLELDGLRTRRASLDQVRREPERLIAPVSGVVAEGTPVAGQIAQPNTIVFHILDPATLWIEALSFDALTGSDTASGVTATGQRLPLAYRGTGFAGRNQSVPVHFAIQRDSSDLRAGQLVTVMVQTADEKRGIAVPRTSIVRSINGQDFVYVHVSAERFEPRAVRIENLDGDNVMVLAGIELGQRIVTRGAELLDHIR